MALTSALARKVRRYAFLDQIRPASLAAPLYRAVFPGREIVEAEGLSLSVSLATLFGRMLVRDGAYEPETVAIFRERIKPGATVLDIGANEGFFSALAAKLVGPEGFVIAAEPQSRLIPILEQNLALNAACPTLIAHNAVAENDGEAVKLSLFPENNTGASGLVRTYRWGGKTETVQTVTPATLLARSGRGRLDFVKVDVEGFEPEVARALPMDRIGDLLLDYHAPVLADRGLDPAETDALIRRTHRPVRGTFDAEYVLYEPQ